MVQTSFFAPVTLGCKDALLTDYTCSLRCPSFVHWPGVLGPIHTWLVTHHGHQVTALSFASDGVKICHIIVTNTWACANSLLTCLGTYGGGVGPSSVSAHFTTWSPGHSKACPVPPKTLGYTLFSDYTNDRLDVRMLSVPADDVRIHTHFTDCTKWWPRCPRLVLFPQLTLGSTLLLQIILMMITMCNAFSIPAADVRIHTLITDHINDDHNVQCLFYSLSWR